MGTRRMQAGGHGVLCALLAVCCAEVESPANGRSPVDGGRAASLTYPNQPEVEAGASGSSAAFPSAETSSPLNSSGASATDGPNVGPNFDLPSEARPTSELDSTGGETSVETTREPDSSKPSTSTSDVVDAAGTSEPDAGPSEPGCMPCEPPPDPCWLSVCNPLTTECELVANVGAYCDDGNACTDQDTCEANGACVGAPKLCQQPQSPCSTSACNPDSGECQDQQLPNTTTCDDGNPCTVGDSCDGLGACFGSSKDCSGLDGECVIGECNDQTGQCDQVPTSGNSCDDGNACTVSDTCAEGQCAGTAKDCSDLNQACVTGVCDLSTGACTPSNLTGVPCDDANACTANDVCTNGTCGGLAPDTCQTGARIVPSATTTVVQLNTECVGVSNQFDIANYLTRPPQASGGDCTQSTGPDVYVLLDLTAYQGDIRVKASTDQPATLFDTVLALLGSAPGSEEQCGYNVLTACNDDISVPDKRQSTIDVVVAPGSYALVVDGYYSKKLGQVDLSISVTPQ